ncbi:MAG: hypothetical protein GX259_05980 [Bacteroidales bacterium]|nr:hypothetical protein [Bacteroidales bacterium]
MKLKKIKDLKASGLIKEQQCKILGGAPPTTTPQGYKKTAASETTGWISFESDTVYDNGNVAYHDWKECNPPISIINPPIPGDSLR